MSCGVIWDVYVLCCLLGYGQSSVSYFFLCWGVLFSRFILFSFWLWTRRIVEEKAVTHSRLFKEEAMEGVLPVCCDVNKSVYLGLISYEIYLVHMKVFNYLSDYDGTRNIVSLWQFLLLTLTVAVIFHHVLMLKFPFNARTASNR